MNEEQLADILAQHLDVFLEEEPLSETLPAEITPLLAVAQNLTQAAPAPRPEFGPALKERLLTSIAQESGAADSMDSTPPAGSSSSIGLLPLLIIGLIAFIALSMLMIGLILFDPIQSTLFDSSSPTPQPDQIGTVPVQPALPSPLPATSTAAPTIPALATTPIISPTATATAIIDVLPRITVTIVTVEAPPLPPALVPGPGGGSGSDNDDGGGSGGGSDNGGDNDDDHDRGHGNDDDRHDEDNPGNKKN